MGSPVNSQLVRTLVACALVCATAFASGADGASSTVVVTADVPSASTLINGCTSAAATQFGALLPDSGARTATGAGVCRLTFGSSNNTSQLRISQKDGIGSAMALGIEQPTILARASLPGRTNGVFGYDATDVWAVGRSQTLFRTANGGSSWAEYSTPSGDNFDVEAVPGNPDTWWVVGDSRRIWRTVDAQVAVPTWTDQAAALTAAGWPVGIDIYELSIPDNDTIVVVGESRWIGVYDISANTWTAFQHATAAVGNLVAVDALDATTFLAVSDAGRVLYTTTKGLNSAAWSVTALPAGVVPTDIAFGSSNRAYVTGADGFFASWDGATWTDRRANLGAAIDLGGVDAVPGSPDTVIAVDEYGGVFRSTSAGASWTHRSTGAASRMGDVHAMSGTVAYSSAAERNLGRSADAGASWSTYTINVSDALTSVAASPVNGERLLTVGTSALRSTNGGTSWTSASLGVARAMHGVSLADDSRGWAVGERSTILHTTDLGATWSVEAPPAGMTEDLTDVVALDQYRAVAVGHAGTILRTANGGVTWTTATSGTTMMLTGVDSVGDLLVATGARGTVLRSTDAGATWTAIVGAAIPDPVLNLIDVDLVNALDGYIAVTYDDVWRTADGGVTWTLVAGGTATMNRGIAADGSTVVVAGLNDQVARSTDRGATFQQTFGSTGLHLNAVVAIDPHRAVIVGPDTLRYEMDATPSANAQVADWGAPANDWDSGGFFGVCLQAVGGGALADWTPDATGTIGECEVNAVDPWRSLPATGSLAAHTNAAGLGTVDLVWGFRPKTTQAPGTYEAGVAFEAVSP